MSLLRSFSCFCLIFTLMQNAAALGKKELTPLLVHPLLAKQARENELLATYLNQTKGSSELLKLIETSPMLDKKAKAWYREIFEQHNYLKALRFKTRGHSLLIQDSRQVIELKRVSFKEVAFEYKGVVFDSKDARNPAIILEKIQGKHSSFWDLLFPRAHAMPIYIVPGLIGAAIVGVGCYMVGCFDENTSAKKSSASSKAKKPSPYDIMQSLDAQLEQYKMRCEEVSLSNREEEKARFLEDLKLSLIIKKLSIEQEEQVDDEAVLTMLCQNNLNVLDKFKDYVGLRESICSKFIALASCLKDGPFESKIIEIYGGARDPEDPAAPNIQDHPGGRSGKI